MTAHVFMTCKAHPHLLMCDDDAAYKVETVAAALTLHAARFPQAVEKTAYIALTCELAGCRLQVVFEAATVAEARAIATSHRHGWYQAKRADGRLADGCQFHLGTCCVHHTSADSYTPDRAAVLPGEQGQAVDQLDLFGGAL